MMKNRIAIDWSLPLIAAGLGMLWAFGGYPAIPAQPGFPAHLISLGLGLAVMLTLAFSPLSRAPDPWWLFGAAAALQVAARAVGGRFVIFGAPVFSLTEAMLFAAAFSGFAGKLTRQSTLSTLKLTVIAVFSLWITHGRRGDGYALPLLICYGVILYKTLAALPSSENPKTRRLSWAIAAAGLLIAAAILLTPLSSTMSKLDLFLDGGWSDPTERGYPQVVSNDVLKNADMLSGIDVLPYSAKPETMLRYYPLISLIAARGWIYGIAALALFAIFTTRIMVVLRRNHRPIAFGVGMLLIAQIVLGCLMNMNLLPHAWVPLPVLGETGFPLIARAAMIGILSRRQDVNGQPLSLSGESGRSQTPQREECVYERI